MRPDTTRVHIDAETLAAWADHGLSADAAAEVELHLSNCDRCQEMLAAFARSEPAPAAVILPFWSRRPVRWSAAGLAAAAAIVAMVWIGRPPSAPVAETTMAMRDAAPVPTPAGQQPASVDQVTPKAVVPAPTEARADEALTAQKSLKKESTKPAQSLPAAAPPPPPPVIVTAASPAVPPPGAAQVGLAGGIPRQESVSDAFAPVTGTIVIIAPNPPSPAFRAVTQGAGGGGRGGSTANVARDAAENVGQVRWRILGGTRIERSEDAGANWTALTIEPELKTPMLEGAATSPTNCWLAGRDGVVLVTTDGKTFRRVSLPEAVHLTAITAVDPLHATVTAIDGRTFTTVDGGLTWK